MAFKTGNCPRCKEDGKRLDALSRKDNETMICGSCGTAEALEDLLRYGKGEQ